MKRLTELTPLITGFSAALLVVVAMVQPAVSGGQRGEGACRSWLPGVSTHHTAPVYKKCGGSWDGCLTSMGVTHKSMNYAAIDFREPGFSGSVRVAVLPNDPAAIPGPHRGQEAR